MAKNREIKPLKDKRLIELTFNTLLATNSTNTENVELDDSLIEKMLNFTPIYRAVNSLIRGVISRDLVVKSESSSEQEQAKALEIQKRINSIKNKTNFIENLSKSYFTRRCLHEIIYNEDFTIKEFVNVPYRLVQYNSIKDKYELKGNSEIDLTDKRKWLLSIYNKTIDKKLGESILTSIVDDYMNIVDIESKMKYLWTKYGETLLIFAYGIDTSDEDIKRTAEELRQAQGRNVIAIPLADGNLRDNIFSLRLTDMDTVIHERLIEKYEKNIITTILGGTLTIDNNGSSGSYSLGQIQQEEKEKIEDSIALFIRDELDKILEIDSAFFGYDKDSYYISIDRVENEEQALKVEREKTELLNVKISGIEALSRAGYELDKKELSEYLGFKTIATKEYSSRLKEFERKISKREEKEIHYIKLFEKYKEEIIEELIENTRKELRKVKKIADIYKIQVSSEKQFKTLILANLVGRYLAIDTVEKRAKKEFEKEEFNTLDEEIKAIVTRKPKLYKELEDIAEKEKQNYFWIKKAQSLEITKKIQDILVKGIKEGKDKYNILIDLEDNELLLGEKIKSNYWSGVIDMNIALAQSRGNFEEMQVLKDEGFSYAEYSAITDGRTTPICNSLHGKVMKIDEFQKNGLVPPLHYRCRSTLVQLADEDVVDSKGKARKGIKLATKEDIEHFKKQKQKGFGNVGSNLEEYVKDKEKAIANKQKELYNLSVEDKINDEPSAVRKMLNVNNVEYKEVLIRKNDISEAEIIKNISGGDLTKGSCVSLALAYAGNKQGWEVYDFRGGISQQVFSSGLTCAKFLEISGVKGRNTINMNGFLGVEELLRTVEKGKEYILIAGKHASVIRKKSDIIEYLELQAPKSYEKYGIKNGWDILDKKKLKDRFGVQKSRTIKGIKFEAYSYLVEIDSFKDNEEVRKILGYLNTSVENQLKGEKGDIK